MIRHMRHGSPPRLKAFQSILSPNRRESLPTPSAGVRIRRNYVPAANLDGPVTVGVTLPETVELFALPQDTVTEVPTVTRYKFLSTSNVIAVVDPETRKVIQIIQN